MFYLKYQINYIRITMTYLDILSAFVCFYSALYSHYFGSKKELHTEQILNIDIFCHLVLFTKSILQIFLFIVPNLSLLRVNDPFSITVYALETQTIFF